jgi:enoyl-[acyl-carrier-protein] reductase (NADH)
MGPNPCLFESNILMMGLNNGMNKQWGIKKVYKKKGITIIPVARKRNRVTRKRE